MSAPFEIPEWLLQAAPPPPPTPPVDDHRVESLVNRFIAGKQEALFTAPDAFYRLQGADAVQGRPAIAQRLLDLRAATLEQARDDGERAALDPRLDLHIDDAMDGVDRHVVEQRRVYQRQVVSQRQALIQRAAELEHDNDDKIMGLAEANVTAARERARMDGIVPDTPEEAAAMLGARSNILHTAIDARLANNKGPQAIALFDRVKDQLAPADRRSLDTPVQAARLEQAADQWIARETATDGPPLQQRLDVDADLPSDAKPIVQAKLGARESADESARVAKVQALDDEVRDAIHAQAVNPNTYRLGTFARLANAYDAAGAPDRAASARRMAAQEAFIEPFAQASVEKQQKLMGELPDGDVRDGAMAVQALQARAFANDPFAAGTTLYKEIGPPAPIDDVAGRIRQARQVSHLRGIPVAPLTADENEEALDQTNSAVTVQRADRAVGPNLAPYADDPNLILVAGDKEKRLRLHGTANQRQTWSDDEPPEPKQIDILGGSSGGGGGGSKLPRIQRSSPKGPAPAPRLGSPIADEPGKLSPEERQRRAKQLEENAINGKAWEMEREEVHRKEKPDVGTQVTVQTPTGSRGRIDIITRDAEGNVECFECKASETAPVRQKQQKFFDDFERLGGTIMGDGKPTFGGGLELPPTPMQIERKRR